MAKFSIFIMITFLGGAAAMAQKEEARCYKGEATNAPELVRVTNLEQFSLKFLGAEYANQPEFAQAWMSEVVDTDGDRKLAKSEIDKIVCETVGIFERELPNVKPGALINKNGNTDWMAFYASRPQISGLHLKFELAAFGRDWAKRQLVEGLDTESLQKLEVFLREGAWSVAEKEPGDQADLMGSDRTPSGLLEKNLALAYRVSEYKKQMGADWPVLKAKLLAASQRQKSFPYIAYPGKGSVIVAFNTVTPTSYGVEGSTRYYVLLGQKLTLSTTKPDVWGQPSEQMFFILSERSAYPSTDRFVTNLRKKLQRLCKATTEEDYRMIQTGADSFEIVNKRMQALTNKLSDLFMEDEVKIEVVNASLEGNDRAHHDVTEGKIQFSWPDLLSVVNYYAGGNSEINRHIVFLMIHEYVHVLQSKNDIYEMNGRTYNNAQHANMMFGDEGYRKYYLAQPLENDAQGLAGEFVQMLDNQCDLPPSQ